MRPYTRLKETIVEYKLGWLGGMLTVDEAEHQHLNPGGSSSNRTLAFSQVLVKLRQSFSDL